MCHIVFPGQEQVLRSLRSHHDDGASRGRWTEPSGGAKFVRSNPTDNRDEATRRARMRAGYPQLRGFIWFNYNKETDWRVESSIASVSAFKAAFVADPYFVWR